MRALRAHTGLGALPTSLPMRRIRVFLSAYHLLHDAPEHRRRKAATVRARRACGDLFEGLYWAA